MPAFGLFHDLWHHVAATQPVPAARVIAASSAIALLVVIDARTWRLARNSITIAHEGGHALASVLAGRRLQGIRIHTDTSGVTSSRGKSTGPGAMITLAAGYVTPSLLGAGAAWLLAAHYVTAMLWLMLALLAATFLAMRNAYGVLAVLVSVGAVLAVSWFAPAAIQAAFGYTAAWFLLFGGLRAVIELQTHRRRSHRSGQPAGSDADALGRLTGLPGGTWVAIFALVCVAALILGTHLLIPGLLHVTHLLHLPHLAG
jgi:hypothetical protein